MRQEIDQESEFEIQFPTQLPLFRAAPNQERLNEWAESQCTPMTKRIAHKIVKNLQYICFEDFLSQLKKVVDDFHTLVPDEPYILMLGESDQKKLDIGCSDLWCIGLALEHCGLREPEVVLTPNQFLRHQKKYQRISHILMLDDAAYSGSQKTNILKAFSPNGISLSLYLGIPFMTHTAKKVLADCQTYFKELIVLDQQNMPTMNEILDSEEYHYAQSVEMNYISDGHALTYFDHRFADLVSAFQTVYRGESLLIDGLFFLMTYFGMTRGKDLAEKNKNISYIENRGEYLQKASSVIFPFYLDDVFGYCIPVIIPPYRLNKSYQQKFLAAYIAREKVGERTPYPFLFAIPSIDYDLEPYRFAGFRETSLTREKQVAFDFAVMLNIHQHITFIEQKAHTEKLQIVHDELKNNPPMLKNVPPMPPRKINMGCYNVQLHLLYLMQCCYRFVGSELDEDEPSPQSVSMVR